MEKATGEEAGMVCIICLQRSETSGHIRWNDRIGSVCATCSERVWTCPDCSRSFYVGENKDRPPRHYVEEGANKPVCDGWKSEKRRLSDAYLRSKVPWARF